MTHYGVLKQDKLIKQTIVSKQRLINQSYIMHYHHTEASESFVTVVVSKKISKLAVIRNKIKRQVKMMIRTHPHWFVSGFNIVIVIKPNYLEHDFTSNCKALNTLFKKLGGTVSVKRS